MNTPKVLIACDKFKGTLTAREACEAIAGGITDAWPDAQCVIRPMADGGEGTSLVVCEALGGEWRTADVTGPMGDPVNAGFCWLPAWRTAVIEMSEASGLKLVPPERRNPWRATTAGTGQLMQAALRLGAERIIVGIGGSATNDGGAGMAWALGYRFLNAAGEEVMPVPARMAEVQTIRAPDNLNLPEVIAACDVTNPLLGPEGATRVYGPQKGVSLSRMPEYEEALQHLADLAAHLAGRDLRNEPGAGAAGGLGFGLMAFCRASTRPGFDLVAEVTGLEAAVRECDLVITGEGCLDSQTLHGKGPARIAEMARSLGRPTFAIGGIIEEAARPALSAVFDRIAAAATPETLQACLAAPAAALRRAARACAEM